MKHTVAAARHCSASAADAGRAAPATAWVEQSRQLASQLGGQLKGELTQAISEGGPIAAINVCYLRAPEIAAQLSQASGARVGRTALRVRNPSNAPDDLERSVLEQFAADLGSGRSIGRSRPSFEIRRGDAVERRYMRAIPDRRPVPHLPRYDDRPRARGRDRARLSAGPGDRLRTGAAARRVQRGRGPRSLPPTP
jgi:hypothetical protein